MLSNLKIYRIKFIRVVRLFPIMWLYLRELDIIRLIVRYHDNRSGNKSAPSYKYREK